MLRNQDIVCISSIDWDFVWQGHQEIMSTFAKNGNRVLFIENTGVRAPTIKDIPRLKKRLFNWLKSVKGFRQISRNLYVYSPVLLPFPFSRTARWFNSFLLLKSLKKWMKVMEFYNPVIWTFLPTGIALDIINNIDRKLLVYYCIADFYALVDKPEKIKKTETELARECDVIFTQGEMLKKRCSRYNVNVHIFPFGVNMEAFEEFRYDLTKTPEDIKTIRKPILGYIGGIHKHIDFDLLYFMAESHPEWSLVLVGPVQTELTRLAGMKNVYFLGKKEFKELPLYINEFDVGIIPYSKNEYTHTVFPTKLNEYHALGKPVVSTDLPEVVKFNAENDNLVLVAKTRDDFLHHISRVLTVHEPELIKTRIASARKNAWPERIERMSAFLEEAIERKAQAPLDWRKRFLFIYGQAQKKIVRISLQFLFVYLLLFYTPLMWFVASPLKITQPPQKADAIVVFAGGVGESGKWGQGYEERVLHAVELYKKGYAGNLIFSSGYKYVFMETLVMKALAESLGVPAGAITLEDKAARTYENVKNAVEILDSKRWKNTLVVSSPYHMRRVSLVFKKIGKNINAVYTPVPNSLFYSHPYKDANGKIIYKRISLQQLNGIIREYIGIVYYWLKGWI